MAAGYKEIKGKLSFFVKTFRLLFWGWQILMVWLFMASTTEMAPIVAGAQSDAARAGAGLGVVFSWGVIVFFWVSGTVILGLFVLMSRRTRMLVPVDKDQ